MKIVRNVLTLDAPISMMRGITQRRSVRDDVLEAVPVGKMLVSGTVWLGDLKPQIDRHLDMVQAFTTPFTLGRLLHAERSSAPLDLARTWIGDLIEHTDKTATNSPRSTSDVDLGAVRASLEVFHRTLGTRPFDAHAYEQALLAVRDAAAAVRTNSPSGRTVDARAEAQATRARVAALNERHRQHWVKDVAPRGVTAQDSVAAVRDAVAAAHRAMHPREKIAFISAAHKSFWANRSNSAKARDGFAPPRQQHPIEAHAQTSPADLNARNRAFWANR